MAIEMNRTVKDETASELVVADTFLRFKGVERIY